MTHAERKVKGIEIMKKMDIYKPYIEDFEKRDRVCYFEYYAGYWVFQEPEVEARRVMSLPTDTTLQRTGICIEP